MNQQNAISDRNLLIGLLSSIAVISVVISIVIMLLEAELELNKVQDVSTETRIERINLVVQVKFEGVPEASIVSVPITVPETTPYNADILRSEVPKIVVSEPATQAPVLIEESETLEVVPTVVPVDKPEKAEIVPAGIPEPTTQAPVSIEESETVEAVPTVGDS